MSSVHNGVNQEWETAWAALTCEVPTSSPSSLGTTGSVF